MNDDKSIAVEFYWYWTRRKSEGFPSEIEPGSFEEGSRFMRHVFMGGPAVDYKVVKVVHGEPTKIYIRKCLLPLYHLRLFSKLSIFWA